MMGACPSERGLAGTTPDQVKQSLIGAGWVWASALGGPLLDGAGGLLSRLLAPKFDDIPALFKPGPWARGSIPARDFGRDFTATERNAVNDLGNEFGCHSCGATSAGTKTGNWVLDHQPVSRFVDLGTPQQLYPQCLVCSNQQGLEVINWLRRGLNPYGQ
jgi:hypothetical protein